MDPETLVSEGFEVRVTNPTALPFRDYPAAIGVSLPEGGVTDVDTVEATAPDGTRHPVQAMPLAVWPDGSVKWVLIELPADLEAPPKPRSSAYKVRFSEGAAEPLGDVRVEESADQITVSNGVLTLAFDRKRFALFSSVTLEGAEIIGSGECSDILLEDKFGKRYCASRAADYRAEVEHAGPVRATVRLSGKHRAADGTTFLDFRVRVSVFHNCPSVLVEHQIVNREDTMPGVKVAVLKLVQKLNVGDEPVVAVRQGMHGADTAYRPISGIRQDMRIETGTARSASLGGEGAIVTDPQPFDEDFSVMDFHIREFPAVRYSSGLWLDVSGSVDGHRRGATVFFRNMLENQPKIVENRRNEIALHVIPRMPEDLDYMQGWSKRHEIIFCFHQGAEDAEAGERDQAWIRWTHQPGVIVPFAWYQKTKAEDMDKIMPHRLRKYPLMERNLEKAPEGGNWQGESAPPPGTGMLNWGDFCYGEARPGWSPGTYWCNNEEDFIYGDALLALRNEDASGLSQVRCMARHQIDIDTLSYSQDPLRNGAVIPHAVDHTRGAPYTSHIWFQGSILYYYLSGDPDAREAAVSLGDFLLRFIERRFRACTATGREHGWPILTLCSIYELTRDEKYLEGACKLIEDVERRLDEYGGVWYSTPWGLGEGIGPYANYSIYQGIYKYYQQTGDEEMRRLFLRIIDRVIEVELGEEGYQLCRNGKFYPLLYPFAMAYYMTGEERYAEAGKIGFTLLLTHYGFSDWGLREALHFLKIADERGWIEKLQPQGEI